MISLEEKEGVEEREETGAACYLTKDISASNDDFSIGSGQIKTLPLLSDIKGISNCSLPQRFIFLEVVYYLFCSLTGATFNH